MGPETVSSPPPPDPVLLETTLRTRLPFRAELVRSVPLCGDASNRRYYRLELNHAPVPSLILMQLADPEGFKVSEEAVSTAAADIHELPFLNILRPLARLGIPVPVLHFYDETAGLLYLEDFGDLTLFHACLRDGQSAVRKYYPVAVDTLVRIHLQLTAPGAGADDCQAFSRSFDARLLMWEFEHFLEYGIWARHDKKPMCADDEKAIRSGFSAIAEWMAIQPQVFTHRDYHSRNLMVHGDRLGVIDFQDALLGPATYDLASLLRDSYVALDEKFVDEMLARYVTGMRAGLEPDGQERLLLTDRAAFRRLFDFTSIQRNLKAAGRFVYIDRVKGNPKFLADIPRTLGYVRRNLEKYPELHPLLLHLTPYIPEWR
ncbi:MAG: phosphotransferase [Nitrospira sp. SB0667_bin_9]|nr:phosphotransferase [Nitrospira sp. SB0667_bin_9]MYD30121.1 phosphotransferase [Nitrospira sp. SB0661_bin_20]MYJ23112.1 phosphotransferase [Nitrospira sp. SB0673_bin_12]